MAAGATLITVCVLLFVFATNRVLAARVIVGITGLLSVAVLLLCSLSDPGLKPRQPPPPPDAPPHESQWREREYVDERGQVRHAKLERKWCYSCNTYRPYRGVHCRYCDRCVGRRDHHCPWTGTCIGVKNYRSFFAFVWLLSVTLFTALIGGIQSLVQRVMEHNKATEPEAAATSDRPSAFTLALVDTYCVEFLLILLSFVFGLLAWSLAVYHTYLVSQNLTSGDEAKNLDENVFTHGSVAANLWAALTGWREEQEEVGGGDSARSEVVIEAGDFDAEDEAPSATATAQQDASHATLYDGCEA